MSSGEHERVWQTLAESDPDWAVLTERTRRHGGWDRDLEEFYASGRAAIDEVLGGLPDRDQIQAALDFGCGTGRLTLALAEQGMAVTAVDVAPAMLELVASRAHARGLVNVRAVHANDVEPDHRHGLALSLLVLQHLPDRSAVASAIVTMVGALHPGGHLVVEIPDRAMTMRSRVQPRWQAYRLLRSIGISPQRLHRSGLSGISMLTLSERDARALITEAGARVVDVTRWSDSGHRYVRYFATAAG
jgi:2-polyprenyl-3-methyl-5-hydroxy-6-metoxy-1,4-benzoquinol methylase